MNTKQYVSKYKLDDETFANRFNTNTFLEDLDKDFKERIQAITDSRKKEGLEFSYRIFLKIVSEMQQKFCAISNKKVGGPLHESLWSAFYAKSVIPTRANLFPAEHQEIQAKREAKMKREAEKEKTKE